MDETTSEISVPLLVAREELSLPVISYNVIELFIKDSKLDQVLPAVTKSFAKTNASALIAFITGDASDSLCVVKTSKKDTVIPKGQTVNVTCHGNTGPVERRSPVLFEPDEQPNWSSGLTVHESFTTVKRGNSSSIDIPVSNTTEHDILLPLGYHHATSLSLFTIDQNSLYEDEVLLSHNPTCSQMKTVDLAQGGRTNPGQYNTIIY